MIRLITLDVEIVTVDGSFGRHNTSILDTSYGVQPHPAEELCVLSQPPDSSDISHFQNYVYPVGGPSGGAESQTFVYHAELGINPLHDDFSFRTIEWLYTGRTKFLGEDSPVESPLSLGGHSSCTASKLAGMIYGAAKDAILVVVENA